jgi:hypothetical protein
MDKKDRGRAIKIKTNRIKMGLTLKQKARVSQEFEAQK